MVDLADLAGFFGSHAPSHSAATPASSKPITGHHADGVLPNQPVSLPRLTAADVHLKYDGHHIENHGVPLDDISVRMDVITGAIHVHRLNFKVGTGSLTSHGTFEPDAGGLSADYQADFNQVDLSRLLRATGVFHGEGSLSGQAQIKARGRSVAGMLGDGSGGATLILSQGGSVSALLSDVAGLQFGNALLSALGLPDQTKVQCFVADLPLRDGILQTRALLLQTGEARTVGRGSINLRDQTIDYSLTTRSTHFSVGSLPGPIDIKGPLGSPAIRPSAEVAARAGASVALGILAAPLALLPTVQFGVGSTDACRKALTEAHAAPAESGRRASSPPGSTQ